MNVLRDHLTLLGATATGYPTSPEYAKLETFPNPRPTQEYVVTFHCEEFTSRCPLTQQPDFGALEITYAPHLVCLESKSLKLYLGAFRETGAFWEQLINAITDRLAEVLSPRWIRVTGTMNVRGGIAMTVMAQLPPDQAD